LAGKSIPCIQEASPGDEPVTGLAFPRRLALMPEVAPPAVIMVTLFAGDAELGMTQVAEQDRRFFMVRFDNAQ
jgi:hypothetical protein